MVVDHPGFCISILAMMESRANARCSPLSNSRDYSADQDLKIESPYNTYLNKGLPPGPINNPGRASIMAALYPAENDYLYFVSKGDGYHFFSKTQEEHNQAKIRFKKQR